MSRIYEETMLFDFYGQLLTERQQTVCRLHLSEDYSLAEIAEELSISRQGVHDALKTAFETLSGYEDKLHMIAKTEAAHEALEALPGFAGEGRLTEGIARVKEILSLD